MAVWRFFGERDGGVYSLCRRERVNELEVYMYREMDVVIGRSS